MGSDVINEQAEKVVPLLQQITVSGDGVFCDREPNESRLSNESSRPCFGGDSESERSDSQLSM